MSPFLRTSTLVELLSQNTELSDLNQLRIPRCVKFNTHQPIVKVHGFCDASQRTFGACLYLRSKLDLNGHFKLFQVTVLKISRRAAQDYLVIAIRDIGRLTIDALNQQD